MHFIPHLPHFVFAYCESFKASSRLLLIPRVLHILQIRSVDGKSGHSTLWVFTLYGKESLIKDRWFEKQPPSNDKYTHHWQRYTPFPDHIINIEVYDEKHTPYWNVGFILRMSMC